MLQCNYSQTLKEGRPDPRTYTFLLFHSGSTCNNLCTNLPQILNYWYIVVYSVQRARSTPMHIHIYAKIRPRYTLYSY